MRHASFTWLMLFLFSSCNKDAIDNQNNLKYDTCLVTKWTDNELTNITLIYNDKDQLIKAGDFDVYYTNAGIIKEFSKQYAPGREGRVYYYYDSSGNLYAKHHYQDGAGNTQIPRHNYYYFYDASNNLKYVKSYDSYYKEWLYCDSLILENWNVKEINSFKYTSQDDKAIKFYKNTKFKYDNE